MNRDGSRREPFASDLSLGAGFAGYELAIHETKRSRIRIQHTSEYLALLGAFGVLVGLALASSGENAD
jgi:hypothetical protein